METWMIVVAVFGAFVGLVIWVRTDTNGHPFPTNQDH